MTTLIPPVFQSLPASLQLEGAVSIALEEGIPIFRAAQGVQTRIETLLQKQTDAELTPDEVAELDRYEAIDDYLSFVNRTIRNLIFPRPHPLRLNLFSLNQGCYRSMVNPSK